MNNQKIIVTRRWPAIVEQELQKMCTEVQLNKDDHPMSKQELKNALRDADCVLPTVTDKLDAEVLGVSDPRCKFLGNFGVGFNHIDLEAAKQANLVVTNTPEVLTDCTADLAMTLLLTAARRVGEGERHVRAKAWTGWRPTHMTGTKVTGKKLGLIGFGRIAQALAKKAHFGFDMEILYYDPFKIPAEIAAKYQAKCFDSIEALLPEVDFLSLHCPGDKKTYHLLNEERLALMKPTSLVINTARGDVIDNEALISALANKRLAGAGLDVYEGEPDLHPGFLPLENAVLLPHLGSASIETRIAMGRRVLQNLDAYLSNKEPGDRVA